MEALKALADSRNYLAYRWRMYLRLARFIYDARQEFIRIKEAGNEEEGFDGIPRGL